VTITHQTTDDIKERLRAKLAKITNPEPDVADAVVLNDDPLDVEAVLSEFDDE
jgi:Fe2+ or Zn2+ uptake regulation protein